MRPSILIVDDNANNLKSMEALLSDLDADLEVASSGQEALKRLLLRDFAVILLDVQMPQMDGYETARIIRGRERSRRTPIIFLTAFNRTDEHVHEAYELGAVDFLFKPIQPTVLRAKVAVFLDLHRLRESERQRLEYESAQALEERAERLRALATASGELLEAERPEMVFEVFETWSRRLFQLDGVCLYRKRPEAPPEWLGGCGLQEEVPDLDSPGLSDGTTLVRRDTESPWMRRQGWKTVWLRRVPAGAGGDLVAVAFSRTGREPRSGEAPVFSILSEQVVLAFQRVRLLERLRENDRRKDDFIAMLGHELRNPLAPIRLAIDLVQRRVTDDPAVRKVAQVAHRQVLHMARLLDDLLDVSRITRGLIELRRSRVRLNDLLDTAVHGLEPSIHEKGQILRRVGPEQETWVDADANRLVQVVGNLLHNASKFSGKGQEIRVLARVDGKVLTLRVEDDGAGIPADRLAEIFQPFVQGVTTLDRKGAGLGLGLAVARSLVELHGGTLTAHSDGPGRGSQFVAELPIVCPTEVEAPSAPAPAEERAPHPLTVALIEDLPDIRDSLSLLLESEGLRVVTAADGEQGARLILEERPDVALVDLGLPGIDGFEVARLVRKEAPGREVPLVALTGYGAEADRQRALEAGFDAHLTKPVGIDELTGLLHRLASRRSERSRSPWNASI